jgi:hypothetical protein
LHESDQCDRSYVQSPHDDLRRAVIDTRGTPRPVSRVAGGGVRAYTGNVHAAIL